MECEFFQALLSEFQLNARVVSCRVIARGMGRPPAFALQLVSSSSSSSSPSQPPPPAAVFARPRDEGDEDLLLLNLVATHVHSLGVPNSLYLQTARRSLQSQPLKFPSDGANGNASCCYTLSTLLPDELSPLSHERVVGMSGPALCAVAVAIARYSAALREIPGEMLPPAAIKNHWDRADSLGYLLDELLPLSLSQLPFSTETIDARVQAALLPPLRLLAELRPLLEAVPKQLTHGDLSLSNVLVSSSSGSSSADSVAIVDFTPYVTESHLYSFLVFLFWAFVYGDEDSPESWTAPSAETWERALATLRAYHGVSPLSSAEVTLITPLLLKVSLRALLVVIFFRIEEGPESMIGTSSSLERYAQITGHLWLQRDQFQQAIEAALSSPSSSPSG